MKTLLFIVALIFAPLTFAQTVTLEWSLPAVDCEGDPATYAEMEIFVSEAPIPASDTNCDGDPGFSPDPRPAGNNIVLAATTPNVGNGSLDVELLGGRTYYVRARVSNPAGQWSNLSLQVQRDVPAGRLQVPVIIRLGG